MKRYAIGTAMLAASLIAGCSAQDPVDKTPDIHAATPTNRSTVMSWELNREPYYTQPGVNSGTIVAAPKSIPSQRRYEPYDAIANHVYQAINEAGVNTKYIFTTAKDGTVIVSGSADSTADVKKALDIATKYPGVKHVRSELTVASNQ